MDGTRVELLDKINSWIKNRSSPNIFLLTGDPGTGKSTIARTIAEMYTIKRELAAYIFFTRGKTDTNATFDTVTNTVIRTIASNIACRNSQISHTIYSTLKMREELYFSSTDALFDELLFTPLKYNEMSQTIVIVLDALDECGSLDEQIQLARLFRDKFRILPSNIRFFVTSRPEHQIVSILSPMPSTGQSCYCVHEKLDHKSESSRKDVTEYIRHSLEELRNCDLIKVGRDRPWEEIISKLGRAADGLFIRAAMAIEYIEENDSLEELLNDTERINLDTLYSTIFEGYLLWKKAEGKVHFPGVVSLILFGKTPMLDVEIDEILDLRNGTTKDVLRGLQLLIDYESGFLQIRHISLYHYLTSPRTSEKDWYIDAGLHRKRIASRCFELMKSQLRFNICDLESSFVLNDDVPDFNERVKKNISPALQYACLHWASHLRDIPYSEELKRQLDHFVYNQLLHWVEILSLTKRLHPFLGSALKHALEWVGNKDPKMTSFLEDAYNYLLEFIIPISKSTPHIYMSFLPVMRQDSEVARHYLRGSNNLTHIVYTGERQKLSLVTQIDVSNGTCLASISPTGEEVYFVSSTGVSLWDIDSGELRDTSFEGESIISFCNYGLAFASVNRDGTTHAWRVDTGRTIRHTFKGDVKNITSVSTSLELRYIATSLEGGNIQIWDTEGDVIGESLRGHSGKVLILSFSYEGEYLASGSEDKSIIIWNTRDKRMKIPPLKGHSDSITSITFSYNGKNIVSGSLDETIRLWDANTGEMLQVFSGSGMASVYSVAYSSNGRYILSGSEDGVVRLWIAEDSKVPPKRFEGHTQRVTSVSFSLLSTRFASTSKDGTIRVWDTEGGHSIVDGPIDAIAISPNGEYLVSGSTNSTVNVWDVDNGKIIKGPLKGHDSWISSLSFSSDGRHFASGSGDNTIRIWDSNGDSITCKGHTDTIRSICFSPDRKHIASASWDKTIRIWDCESGSLILSPLKGHSDWVSSICYSPDGSRIVSGSEDKTIRIWDVLNGNLIRTLEGHSDSVVSVAYSHSSYYIISGSADRTIRLWDANSGEPVYEPMRGHTNIVTSLCFSSDDKWVTSGSSDKSVRLWNVSTGKVLFKGFISSEVNCVAFFPSLDNEYIKFVSGSEDGLIRIWCINIESDEETWNGPFNDGWLTKNDGSLLIWFPPSIRRTLVGGPCTRILNSHYSTTLTMSKYEGDRWVSCFPLRDLL
ncbi:WD40 domain containing protein [Pyrrhoderma noxium]|uniref:WD40 domain containing protein n=1 Tax=Pyrrhoderma noxium TaxID=2282107 RepID=A0A286U8A1_9AGAM|nr:WD40 domain containing protein [Pyrrhoderma noxium]